NAHATPLREPTVRNDYATRPPLQSTGCTGKADRLPAMPPITALWTNLGETGLQEVASRVLARRRASREARRTNEPRWDPGVGAASDPFSGCSKTPPPALPRSGEGRKSGFSPLPASGRGRGRGFEMPS